MAQKGRGEDREVLLVRRRIEVISCLDRGEVEFLMVRFSVIPIKSSQVLLFCLKLS